MKIRSEYVAVLLVSVLSLVACTEDEHISKSKYNEGVLIINEGNFGSGDGSITHYNQTAARATQNIFRNSLGDFAGNVVQSLTLHENKAYLVINGDNKIEVVDGTDFQAIRTITNPQLDKPRYMEIIDGKAYISVWGAYDQFYSLVDSYIMVYDLNTGTFAANNIDTDEGTENLLYAEERLFASNYNYGASRTVSVIDPADNSVVDHVELAAGPAGMVTDINGKLWVVCVGAWGATEGQLYRINPLTLEVEQEITIQGVPGMDIATTPDKQHILYTVGKNIYKLPIAATQEVETPLFNAVDVVSLSAIQVDAATGNIWIGDTPSYTNPGSVFVYTALGMPLISVGVGIAPTQIVFQ